MSASIIVPDGTKSVVVRFSIRHVNPFTLPAGPYKGSTMTVRKVVANSFPVFAWLLNADEPAAPATPISFDGSVEDIDTLPTSGIEDELKSVYAVRLSIPSTRRWDPTTYSWAFPATGVIQSSEADANKYAASLLGFCDGCISDYQRDRKTVAMIAPRE